MAVVNPSGLPDPLVPYSPSPTPFVVRTEGFTGHTLTLPGSGGAALRVTLVSSALDTRWANELRVFDVWFTLQNTGEVAWAGAPAAFMTITDEMDRVFLPLQDPRPGFLHPDPEAYGGSNLDLSQTQTIAAGATLQGVAVFRMPGAFRPVTLAISFDDGATWGSWQTSYGPY